jgi:caffeoyl-CoA O-methyltransferase
MNDHLREQFEDYVQSLIMTNDPYAEFHAVATRAGLPAIQVSPLDGTFLRWLVRLVGASRAVEIGTLAGYSAAWIAGGLAEGGKLFTVEVSAKHADVARQNLESAGLGERVEVMQGEGAAMLPRLAQLGPFDFVFIDADKPGYLTYLEWAANNLRSGGLLAAHNAFRGGGTLNPETEADHALDAFNRTLSADIRLDAFILPLGDGMAMARRK